MGTRRRVWRRKEGRAARVEDRYSFLPSRSDTSAACGRKESNIVTVSQCGNAGGGAGRRHLRDYRGERLLAGGGGSLAEQRCCSVRHGVRWVGVMLFRLQMHALRKKPPDALGGGGTRERRQAAVKLHTDSQLRRAIDNSR